MRFLILLVLIGCGADQIITEDTTASDEGARLPQPKFDSIESAIDQFVAEWTSVHPEGLGIITPIGIEDLPQDGVLGVCITYASGFKEIKVDRPSFTAALAQGNVGPRTIIWHELGHCELDRPHTTKLTFSDSQRLPYSIMFPSLNRNPQIYETYKAHYNVELFTGKGTLPDIGIPTSLAPQPVGPTSCALKWSEP